MKNLSHMETLVWKKVHLMNLQLVDLPLVAITASGGLLQDFIDSHMIVEKFWPSLLQCCFSLLRLQTMFVLSSIRYLHIILIRFSLDFDRTTTESSLFFCRLGSSFCCIMTQTKGLTFDSTILWSTDKFMVDLMIVRCPNHQSSTTMLTGGIRCLWFSPNVLPCIMSKHKQLGVFCPKGIVSKGLWFIQMK